MTNEKLMRRVPEWRKDAREISRFYSDENEIPSEHFFRGAVAAYDRVLDELGYDYLPDDEKEGEK